MKEKILEDFRRARIYLLRYHPFFSYLAMYLKPKVISEEESKKLGIDVIAVAKDGTLALNEKFCEYSVKEQAGMLAHEIMHLVFEHPKRFLELLKSKKEGCQYIYNLAGDVTVDNVVLRSLPLPESEVVRLDLEKNTATVQIGGMKIVINNIDKKTTEEIYEEIMKDIPEDMLKKVKVPTEFLFGKDEGDADSDRKEGGTGTEISSISGKGKKELNWKDLAIEAYTQAKLRGDVPAGLERLVEDLVKPKINWRTVLRRYFSQLIPYDYTYSKPHKKSEAVGVYIPAIKKEGMELAVAIDTSGSISEEDLRDFVSEMAGIVQQCNATVWAIICDCEVYSVNKVRNISELKNIKIKGGGGTSHIPVFEELKKNPKLKNVKVLVALTDGYTEVPKRPPQGLTTFWVISRDGIKEKMPFGVTVFM